MSEKAKTVLVYFLSIGIFAYWFTGLWFDYRDCKEYRSTMRVERQLERLVRDLVPYAKHTEIKAVMIKNGVRFKE